MENGRGDVLQDMLSRADAPSYGAQLAQGATALTEAWDANPTKSQNHFMLGHAETWFYGGLAGIRIDLSRDPKSRIRIAPQAVAGVNAVSAQYQSVLGKVGCAWTKQEGRLRVEVEIPAGAQAQVVLAAANANQIEESGTTLFQARGILGVQTRAGEVLISTGSGRYVFDIPLS
jgi:alpha-L-rhamnosidase